MLVIRKSDERGKGEYGWLDAKYTFSFARYVDRRRMGFRSLRVMNEDRVAPGRGFGQHPHDNMEIITVVLEGRLAHKDTLGNQRELVPGMAQVMSAGEGLEHSEFNPSTTEGTHLYQIWIEPDRAGSKAGYVDLPIPPATAARPARVIASADGRDGSAKINADATVTMVTLGASGTHDVAISAGRHAWVQVLRGGASLNGQRIIEGDGAAVSNERRILIESGEGGELLVFDLA